jgi:hypothetical protein
MKILIQSTWEGGMSRDQLEMQIGVESVGLTAISFLYVKQAVVPSASVSPLGSVVAACLTRFQNLCGQGRHLIRIKCP